jgi:hypothetical protein
MSAVPTAPAVGARCALGLAAELFAEGLHEGTPPGLSARAEAIDRQVCRRLRCPACKRRGMAYKPFHGAGRYTVLATCRRCGAGEQV